LAILVVVLAIFAARSIMRPEKFRTVYELRKEANVQNLLAIRSAQAVYKNVNKVYADENLPYSQEDEFDIPKGFDPCHREDDMELVDGDDANSDKQLINQIFE
jgi:hypothetical protein